MLVEGASTQKPDEIITFLSRQTLYWGRFSLCDNP